MSRDDARRRMAEVREAYPELARDSDARLSALAAMSAVEQARVWRLIKGDLDAHAAEQRRERENARAKVKGRKPRAAVLDATPERLALVESDFVDPAKIDSAEQRIGRVRRIVADPLDRWKRASVITLRQYDAGDWWRSAAETAGLVHSGRQGYEPRSGDSDPFARMVPNSMRAYHARAAVRKIGALLSADDRRILDRVCIAGEVVTRGRGRQSAFDVTVLALDRLASALRL